MNVRKYVEIFILGHLFCLSDGAVRIAAINTLSNVKHLECGSSVTLKCETPANTNDMSWEVDGTLEADCVFGTCSDYPPFPGSYSFSDDQVNGVFNLTVSPVKITDNGRTFTCFVPPDSATFTPAVKVLTDNSCSLTETAGSGSVTFVATTGCIYPESDVEIKWYYLEAVGGSAVEVSNSDFAYTSTRNLDNSTCVSGDCSSGTDVNAVSETAVFQQQSEGLEVYIQAKFIHSASSSATVFKSSTSNYKIKKNNNNDVKDDGGLSDGAIAGIVIAALCAVVAIAVVGIIIKKKCDVTLLELDPDRNGSIGLEMCPANMVTSVTPGGSAATAGIKCGQKILSINGEDTDGMSQDDIGKVLHSSTKSVTLKLGKGSSPDAKHTATSKSHTHNTRSSDEKSGNQLPHPEISHADGAYGGGKDPRIEIGNDSVSYSKQKLPPVRDVPGHDIHEKLKGIPKKE